jgi:arylsulfatase A-like enzyme
MACAACGAPSDAPPPPGRIVLLSMDTVRADHVAGYGGEANTPVLAEIAREGVVFQRFYAASNYTLPSHMSIFTGLDPMEHGVVVGAARLAPEVETLAERLAAAGWLTWSFNESGYVADRYGFDRGFREYRQLPPKAVVTSALDEVLAWMRAHREERYFLFLHTYSAHYPYGGYGRYRREHPERGLLSEARIRELRGRSSRSRDRLGRAEYGFPAAVRAQCTLYNQLAENYDRVLGCGYSWLPADFRESPHYAPSDLDAVMRSYDERIGDVDRALGRIRQLLRELRQWDDTLLVVTSDHGEGFFEHGLVQHDYSPFEEVMRVPLVLSFPRRLGAGRVDALAWHLDLLPTVLGLAGVPAPAGLRGVDLIPLLSDAPARQRSLFPVVLSAPNRARKPVRRVALHGGLKWIEGHPSFGDPGGLLFDLAQDPGERRNLRSTRPADARLLDALALEYARGLAPPAPINAETGERIDLSSLVPQPRLSPRCASSCGGSATSRTERREACVASSPGRHSPSRPSSPTRRRCAAASSGTTTPTSPRTPT